MANRALSHKGDRECPHVCRSIADCSCLHERAAATGSTKAYRTIVADPPWHMPSGGPQTKSSAFKPRSDRVGSLPYPTMTLAEIKALPVSLLASKNAHLYIWTVNAFLEATYDVARAWGFTPSVCLTWCKTPRGIGLGGAYTQTTEYVLFCRRGTLPANTRVDSTWWNWKRGAHSAKPEAFLDLVEQVSPGPYLEMFARRDRLGWDTWGNESLGTADMEAA